MAIPRRSAPTSSTPSDDSPTYHSTLRSDTSPLVPPSTIYKLVISTIAMFTLPLLSYYFTLNNIFSGNSTYAGGFAAFTANVVVIGYIIAAIREDNGEMQQKAKAARKDE